MKTMTALLIFGLAAAGCRQDKRVVESYPKIRAVQNGIDMFEVDMGFYPFTLDDLLSTNASSTWHSTTGPLSVSSWKGPYLRSHEVLYDYSTNQMRYTRLQDSYWLESTGPDGVFGTSDDIVIVTKDANQQIQPIAVGVRVRR